MGVRRYAADRRLKQKSQTSNFAALAKFAVCPLFALIDERLIRAQAGGEHRSGAAAAESTPGTAPPSCLSGLPDNRSSTARSVPRPQSRNSSCRWQSPRSAARCPSAPTRWVRRSVRRRRMPATGTPPLSSNCERSRPATKTRTRPRNPPRSRSGAPAYASRFRSKRSLTTPPTVSPTTPENSTPKENMAI